MLQDLKQLEIDIRSFENASTWVQSCKELLAEVQRLYAEGNKPVDDSELAGEVKLWQKQARKHKEDSEFWRMLVKGCDTHLDECGLTSAELGFVERVKKACDAYRSEKERADTLQSQLDAQPQVEAVGKVSLGKWSNLHGKVLYSPEIVSEGFIRTLYAGPAEPIESEVKQ